MWPTTPIDNVKAGFGGFLFSNIFVFRPPDGNNDIPGELLEAFRLQDRVLVAHDKQHDRSVSQRSFIEREFSD
jgi:hypothetical protein